MNRSIHCAKVGSPICKPLVIRLAAAEEAAAGHEHFIRSYLTKVFWPNLDVGPGITSSTCCSMLAVWNPAPPASWTKIRFADKLLQGNTMDLTARRAFALFILIIAAAIGITSLMAFLFFLYAGALNWVHLGMTEGERIVFNTLISVVFFLQHSIMIRRSFRRRVCVHIPSYYQGAVYTLASGFVLLAFVTFWQGSDIILFNIHGLYSGVMRALYLLSILGTGWGMWALRSIDMFGLDPIVENLQAKPSPPIAFTIRGPYRWVRHPLYLFMIVLFWSCPLMTMDRFLFNVLWTIWVAIGTILEERDLVDDFGQAYRDYQANVPMLIPIGFQPAYRTGNSDSAA